MSFLASEQTHAGMLGSATDHYPVMPIFSSRYLLALEDVITEVVFK